MALVCSPVVAASSGEPIGPKELTMRFREQVDCRLDVPATEAQRYAHMGEAAFIRAKVVPVAAQGTSTAAPWIFPPRNQSIAAFASPSEKVWTCVFTGR